MSIFDSIRDGLRGFIFGDDLYGIVDERIQAMQLRRDYHEDATKQIRPRPARR